MTRWFVVAAIAVAIVGALVSPAWSFELELLGPVWSNVWLVRGATKCGLDKILADDLKPVYEEIGRDFIKGYFTTAENRESMVSFELESDNLCERIAEQFTRRREAKPKP